ncbi:MAG: hypothetical protein AAF337_14795 [Pseudomonadota bacterium]
MSVFWRAPVCLAVSVLLLAAPPVQAGLAPELQRAMFDPVVKEDFTQIIQQAQMSETALDREKLSLETQRAELDRLVSVKDYVVDTADGYFTIGDEDLNRIGATVALNILLNGESETPPVLFGIPSDLRRVISAAMRQDYARWKQLTKNPRNLFRKNYEQRRGTYIADTIRALIAEMNNDNRERIKQKQTFITAKLRAIEENRAYLGDLVSQALDARDRAISEETLYGSLTEAGFYVVRLSGTGWRKKYAGQGERISGYQNFLIYIDPKAQSESRQYLHMTYPARFDVQAKFGEWIAAKNEESEKACASGPPACPCKLPPDIWDDVSYDIIAGPLQSLDEAMKISGRVDSTANLSPTGAKHWTYESVSSKRVKQACAGR